MPTRSGHRFLVVQPDIENTPQDNDITNHELLMAQIQTIPTDHGHGRDDTTKALIKAEIPPSPPADQEQQFNEELRLLQIKKCILENQVQELQA